MRRRALRQRLAPPRRALARGGPRSAMTTGCRTRASCTRTSRPRLPRRAAPALRRVERRQRAAQDVELVVLERRLVKDSAQLELDLLLMRGVQELGLREQALEVLVQVLELGRSREPRIADGPCGRRAIPGRHAKLVAEDLNGHREI